MTKLNEKAIALLKGKNFAYVATLNRDGSPQLTPVWADTDGITSSSTPPWGASRRKHCQGPSRGGGHPRRDQPLSWISVDGKVVKTTLRARRRMSTSTPYRSSTTGNKNIPGKPKEKRILLVIEPDPRPTMEVNGQDAASRSPLAVPLSDWLTGR